jgi:hypothetical protein
MDLKSCEEREEYLEFQTVLFRIGDETKELVVSTVGVIKTIQDRSRKLYFSFELACFRMKGRLSHEIEKGQCSCS